MLIIDISIPLNNETPVWEGDQGVAINRAEKIGEGSDYNLSRMELGVHAGTHIDAPFHFFNNGITVDQIPISNLIGKAQVVEVPEGSKVIDKDLLSEMSFQGGIQNVLFKTTNSEIWGAPHHSFREDYVALNSEGAAYLIERDFQLVGVDYLSISVFHDLLKPHEILLSKGVVLLENIDLRNVKPDVYQLYCLPIKLIGTGGAPARAILIKE